MFIILFLLKLSFAHEIDFDQVKFNQRKCNSSEQEKIISSLKFISKKIDEFEDKVMSELDHNHKDQKSLKKALKVLRCMKKNIPESRFTCTMNTGYAGLVGILGKKNIKISGVWGYMGLSGVLIHELSHTCGTNDAAYFYGPLRKTIITRNASGFTEVRLDVPQNYAGSSWAVIADTYRYWLERGFCIPEGKKCGKLFN